MSNLRIPEIIYSFTVTERVTQDEVAAACAEVRRNLSCVEGVELSRPIPIPGEVDVGYQYQLVVVLQTEGDVDTVQEFMERYRQDVPRALVNLYTGTHETIEQWGD